jgi:hypothetical protein
MRSISKSLIHNEFSEQCPSSARAYYEPDAGVRLRNPPSDDQDKMVRKVFRAVWVQDGPGDFQVRALKAHQSCEAICKPTLLGVEEDGFK